MLLYAKHQFYWSEQQSDGESNRDHLRAARNNAFATMQAPIEDEEEAVCPHELQHLYIWFVELSSARQSGMDICPISFTEIKNWSKLLDIDLKPFEVRTLKRLDTLYINHFRDKR